MLKIYLYTRLTFFLPLLLLHQFCSAHALQASSPTTATIVDVSLENSLLTDAQLSSLHQEEDALLREIWQRFGEKTNGKIYEQQVLKPKLSALYRRASDLRELNLAVSAKNEAKVRVAIEHKQIPNLDIDSRSSFSGKWFRDTASIVKPLYRYARNALEYYAVFMRVALLGQQTVQLYARFSELSNANLLIDHVLASEIGDRLAALQRNLTLELDGDRPGSLCPHWIDVQQNANITWRDIKNYHNKFNAFKLEFDQLDRDISDLRIRIDGHIVALKQFNSFGTQIQKGINVITIGTLAYDLVMTGATMNPIAVALKGAELCTFVALTVANHIAERDAAETLQKLQVAKNEIEYYAKVLRPFGERIEAINKWIILAREEALERREAELEQMRLEVEMREEALDEKIQQYERLRVKAAEYNGGDSCRIVSSQKKMSSCSMNM